MNSDNILGKRVEIRHDNDTISIYQSLSDVFVKENDTTVKLEEYSNKKCELCCNHIQNYKIQMFDPRTFLFLVQVVSP